LEFSHLLKKYSFIYFFHRTIQELAPDLHCVPIFGGTKYEQQISQLNDGADIVIATPGRLRDLMQKRNFV
jgi:superfamily II DNA/RNA helicase